MYDYKPLNIFTCSANMARKQQVLARWEGKKLIVVFVLNTEDIVKISLNIFLFEFYDPSLRIKCFQFFTNH